MYVSWSSPRLHQSPPWPTGQGSSLYAPGDFVFCTVIMMIFAIGYDTMSRHITSAGAFYGYVSYGLGQSIGLSAGLLACLAYMAFEISIVSVFAYFVQQFLLANLSYEWSNAVLPT